MANPTNPWPTAPYNAANPFNPYNIPNSQLTPDQVRWVQLGLFGSTYLSYVPGAYVPSTTNAISTAANTDDQNLVQNATSSSNSVSLQATIPNMLKQYSSYNAMISFQVTTPAGYNKMVNNNYYDPTDWNTICQTGGVGPAKATGQNGKQYFTRDLYIDDVVINTIVGINHENKGSNAVDIDFTINEPLGMDLIEQLYDFCREGLQEPNYLQLAYLLKISFHGYTDNGMYEIIPAATKYIPIKLLNMEIKLSNMGSIYKVSAIAYNEIASSEQFGRVVSMIEMGSDVDLKADWLTANNIDVSPTPPSKKFFTQDGPTLTSATQGWNSAYNAVDNISVSNGTAGIINLQTNKKPGDNASHTTTIAEVLSCFMQCLNNQQQYMKNANYPAYVADIYDVVFVDNNTTYTWDFAVQRNNIGSFPFDPPDISNNQATTAQHTSMGSPVSKGSTSTTTNDANTFNVIAAAKNIQKNSAIDSSGRTSSGITYGAGNDYKLTIAAGSSIVDCLTTFIANSGFAIHQFRYYNDKLNAIHDELYTISKNSGFLSNLPIPDDLQAKIDDLQKYPLNWFIIKPYVEILEYDNLRKTHAHKITYYVKPYDIFNCLSFLAPNGDPVQFGRVVKEYDYMFTGENTEIINFDIEFNTAFLTYSQFNNDTKSQGTGKLQPDKKIIKPLPLTAKPSATNAGLSQVVVSSSSFDAKGTGDSSPERNQSADVQATLYSKADMIQLNLNIYGDPDYIIQDGLFLTFNSAPNTVYIQPGSTENNRQISGIVYDYGEVYANINFKIPQDINLNTGTLDLSFNSTDTQTYSRNIFSGLYRVIKVENKIDKGLFTQKLEMIRYTDTHNFTAKDYAQTEFSRLAAVNVANEKQIKDIT